MTARVLTVTDNAHSALGPSSAKRWINCPASVHATSHLPSTSSEYALEGTAAHAVAEECEKLGVRADHFFEWTVRLEKDGAVTDIVCGQEMVDGVNAFIDYVDDLPGLSLCEATVHYEEWVANGFGTMDRAKVQGTTVHLVDFKYGKGVQVYATENEQLKMYGLGFLEDYGWLFPVIEKFVLHIHQPRLDHADRWEISKADLLTWAQTVLKPAALATVNPKAEFKAGDWCQFCKIRATCMVRASSVFTTVVGEFEDLDAAARTAPPAIGTLSNEQIAVILDNLDNVVKWCADIKRHATAELGHGRVVGGYKLVEGRSSRTWADEVKTAEALLAAGIKKADLYIYKLIGVPAAEKLIGKKHDIFKTLVMKPQGSPTLAPASDKREPMKLDAAVEFDDLDSTTETGES